MGSCPSTFRLHLHLSFLPLPFPHFFADSLFPDAALTGRLVLSIPANSENHVPYFFFTFFTTRAPLGKNMYPLWTSPPQHHSPPHVQASARSGQLIALVSPLTKGERRIFPLPFSGTAPFFSQRTPPSKVFLNERAPFASRSFYVRFPLFPFSVCPTPDSAPCVSIFLGIFSFTSGQPFRSLQPQCHLSVDCFSFLLHSSGPLSLRWSSLAIVVPSSLTYPTA